ncbi:serine/threonine-protein kinase [Sphingobium sp. Sx8-8]|uniref:serine/threonine-protein kinase n=1 Tax=Sphingobium sp. Sx8-8 TaxID=2933617 RepID=UPI001F586C52|nr:serine/threonine-protein kinase [Sphingobium sp. Sx8-8]
MPAIRLNNDEWTFDEGDRLGPPGGFGEVFRGSGSNGIVAVKRLKLTASDAAHREMNIGRSLGSRTLDHVVPILDYGQDANSDGYFLVMPVCDRSLQDEVKSRGVLTLTEAKAVALDVLAGLREVDDIVHRDLKPGNVLYFEDRWRLADFGIAKFVEDSTSLRTLRGSLTPAYGAPEQWRGEAPSHATDVYALGCMLHTMLNGAPPFTGTQDEIREAHLHAVPPALVGEPRLAAFVGQMLRKSPASRPTVERCIEVIGLIEAANARPAHAGLLAAAGQVSRAVAAAEAAAEAKATLDRQRRDLVNEASNELDAIIGRLWASVVSVSDDVSSSKSSISLGRGTLSFSGTNAVQLSNDAYGSRPTWEIVAGATLSLTRAKFVHPARSVEGFPIIYVGRSTPDDRDYKWGATLFFGRSKEDPNYRWRETAFWSFGANRNGGDEPFALQPDDREFQIAFSNTMGATNSAYGPLAIDGEDEDQFQHRWLTLFSKAVTGELNRPNQMPIPDHYLR